MVSKTNMIFDFLELTKEQQISGQACGLPEIRIFFFRKKYILPTNILISHFSGNFVFIVQLM